MAEARCKLEWGQTSLIACILANAHRNPRKRPAPFTADEFNPYAAARERPAVKVSMSELRKIFEARSGGGNHG
jgi:hypothetical protein